MLCKIHYYLIWITIWGYKHFFNTGKIGSAILSNTKHMWYNEICRNPRSFQKVLFLCLCSLPQMKVGKSVSPQLFKDAAIKVAIRSSKSISINVTMQALTTGERAFLRSDFNVPPSSEYCYLYWYIVDNNSLSRVNSGFFFCSSSLWRRAVFFL